MNRPRVIINPGSGPVDDATVEDAAENIVAFVEDLQLPGVTWIRKATADYGEGRFAFTLYYGDTDTEVQMPGIPLGNVRYLGAPQNIWHYPRLYVAGSSWVWCYALDSARAYLTGADV